MYANSIVDLARRMLADFRQKVTKLPVEEVAESNPSELVEKCGCLAEVRPLQIDESRRPKSRDEHGERRLHVPVHVNELMKAIRAHRDPITPSLIPLDISWKKFELNTQGGWISYPTGKSEDDLSYSQDIIKRYIGGINEDVPEASKQIDQLLGEAQKAIERAKKDLADRDELGKKMGIDIE